MENLKGCYYDIDKIIRDSEDKRFDKVTIVHSEVCLTDFISIQLKCNSIKLDHCDIILSPRDTPILTNIEINNCKFKGVINKMAFTANNDELVFIISNCEFNSKSIIFNETILG